MKARKMVKLIGAMFKYERVYNKKLFRAYNSGDERRKLEHERWLLSREIKELKRELRAA